MLPADGIHAMLVEASPHLRAMILLGLNGGLGNTDVSELRWDMLIKKPNGYWLDFPRIKTGVERWIPLWSEMIEAINKVSP